MDAPPPQEDVRPFVKVAGFIGDAGLHGPQVLECDAQQGFLLLSDLGHELYLEALQSADAAQADRLMRDAIDSLVQWQLKVPAMALPAATLSASSTMKPRFSIALPRRFKNASSSSTSSRVRSSPKSYASVSTAFPFHCCRAT